MKSLKDAKVLVLGLGHSGLAMARWCVRCGAEVTVADTREQPPQLPALQSQYPQVRFIAGPFSADLVQGQQAVFKSPGLSPAEVAPVTDAARAAGLPTGNELTLFAAALREQIELRAIPEPERPVPAGVLGSEEEVQDDAQAQAPAPELSAPVTKTHRPRVLAITGTNGKTTVTALTGRLLERAGYKVAVAGNIGPTLLDTLTAVLDADQWPEVWVLELSSFQLHGVDDFEPDAATVLNLSQDHLDWHGSMQAYCADKARIYGQQALMILNRDDAAVMAHLPAAPPKAKLRPVQRAYQTFGAGVPGWPGDWGLEEVAGMTWLVRAAPAQDGLKRRKDEDEPIYLQRLMPAEALRIRGRHNACNALAALAMASAAGGALAPMLHALRDYRGESHRVEPVGVVDGIEFFDDSKGTNVGATVAALRGLGAERSLVIILGGQGKGQDFSPLAEPVAAHARAVVLIGQDAALIEEVLQSTGVPLLRAVDMPQAVDLGFQQARSGDAVLLSPACASFDMFRNYGHRAEVFCAAVRDLAQTRGVML